MNHLVVAGLGICDLQQVTLESQKHILAADHIIYLGTEPVRHLSQLKDWGVRSVQSILELYQDGDVDEANYTRLYHAVVEAASAHAHTVLLVPGHPRIGVTLVQRLVRGHERFQVEVLPGISSFDTLINDLARDPLEAGSILVDANRMLLFDLKWAPTIDCYLYHVCSVGTRLVHVSDAQKDNAWDLLKLHLLQIYPADTEVVLISSSAQMDGACQKISIPLCRVEELLPHVHFGTTLFIPAVKAKRINLAFYHRLRGAHREEAV
jgi:uncharacterized protein YabN with tetrapyrrole methylase and pyrophosphatase domain